MRISAAIKTGYENKPIVMPLSKSFLLSDVADLYAWALFIKPFAVIQLRIQLSSRISGTSDCL